MQHVTARVALIISALIATGVAASAADGLPPPARVPGFTWTGFYIGVNGGYGNAAFEDATVTTSDGTISRGGGGQAKGGIVGGWGYLHTHGNGKSHILRNPSRPRWPRD